MGEGLVGWGQLSTSVRLVREGGPIQAVVTRLLPRHRRRCGNEGGAPNTPSFHPPLLQRWTGSYQRPGDATNAPGHGHGGYDSMTPGNIAAIEPVRTA